MTTRQKMITFRNHRHFSRRDMAEKAECSVGLIGMVESGEVTHPNIAKRIGEAYCLTDIETEDLMPENYRLHGGKYNPDKYKLLGDRDPVCLPKGIYRNMRDYVMDSTY